MHHLSSHFLKVVFSALKLFAVLADFPIVRLISFAWAFILNLLLSFGESLKSRLLFYTTQLGSNSFWRSIFILIKFRYCEKNTEFGKNSPLFIKITFPSISYYFHIPKIFLNFFPHTGKNRNRRKSNLLP